MKKKLKASPMILTTPVVLIGTYGPDDTPNAMTCAWVTVCSHSPPTIGVAIRSTKEDLSNFGTASRSGRKTLSNLVERNAFTINVPPTSMAQKVDYLGIVSGNKEPDKLERLGLGTTKGDVADAPLLDDCPVNAECKLISEAELGSHTWCIGEVVAIHADEGVISKGDRLDTKAIDPLSLALPSMEYYSPGDAVGKGFSMGKALKK